MKGLSNAERLEQIKDKLSDFQTTIWDLTEGDYMFLYKQAEENTRLREALESIERKANTNPDNIYHIGFLKIAKSALEETK